MQFPPGEKLIRDVEEFIELELEDRRKNPSDSTTWIGGPDLVTFALQAYLYGSPKHGRKALLAARKQLLRDVRQAEMPMRVVGADDAPATAACRKPRTRVQVRLGFGAKDVAEHWLALAACHWLLDGEDNANCFRQAAGSMDREYKGGSDRRLREAGELDAATRVFAWAGEDARCVAYCEKSRPSVRSTVPSRVRTDHGMAYLVSASRLNGKWSYEQVASASERFVGTVLPEQLIEGMKTMPYCLWAMDRVWRGAAAPKPTPEQTLARVAELCTNPALQAGPVRRTRGGKGKRRS
jgi:hypothetical protein